MPERKTCTKCRRVLSKAEFHNDKSTRDRLRNWCKVCCAESQRAYVKNNQATVKEKRKEYNKEYWKKNREALIVYSRNYYQRNKVKMNAGNAEYRARYADRINSYEENRKRSRGRRQYKIEYQRKYRERYPSAFDDWRNKNTGKYNQSRAKRRAAKLHATPEWRDEDKIRKIYEQCAQMNKKEHGRITWTVDHIVPLQGKGVCGLHVHNNLRIITLEENSAKKNRWKP